MDSIIKPQGDAIALDIVSAALCHKKVIFGNSTLSVENARALSFLVELYFLFWPATEDC